MGSNEPPFLTSCLILSLCSRVKSRPFIEPPFLLASYSTKASVSSSPTWTFLSEYLVDLKSWSALQDPRTCHLARNGRGQRAKWAWLKFFARASRAFISENPPPIDPGSAPAYKFPHPPSSLFFSPVCPSPHLLLIGISPSH